MVCMFQTLSYLHKALVVYMLFPQQSSLKRECVAVLAWLMRDECQEYTVANWQCVLYLSA